MAKTVTVIVIALVILGGAYYYFSTKSSSISTTPTTTAGSQSTDQTSTDSTGQSGGTSGGANATTDANAGLGQTLTAPATVAITNFTFSPKTLTVKAGTKVVWTNQDAAPHTVTSDTGVFDSKTMSKGATFEHTFTTKGTFSYHCAIHPSMMGTVVVE